MKEKKNKEREYEEQEEKRKGKGGRVRVKDTKHKGGTERGSEKRDIKNNSEKIYRKNRGREKRGRKYIEIKKERLKEKSK